VALISAEIEEETRLAIILVASAIIWAKPTRLAAVTRNESRAGTWTKWKIIDTGINIKKISSK
jgi:ABC-type transporter MlaC component